MQSEDMFWKSGTELSSSAPVHDQSRSAFYFVHLRAFLEDHLRAFLERSSIKLSHTPEHTHSSGVMFIAAVAGNGSHSHRDTTPPPHPPAFL